MNKEQEHRLLAFFAANATEENIDYHMRHNTTICDNGDTLVVSVSKGMSPLVDRGTAIFGYAQEMVKKYKEFCRLLDDDSTSEVGGK